MFAKVLTTDEERDIALLRVKQAGWVKVSISFYVGDKVPGPGKAIFHCGSPGGQEIGAASVLGGNIARVGCRIEEFGDHPFDQVDCAALGGSSGGMICDATNGEYIGMLTLGLRGADNFHWFVPIRIIQEWTKDVGMNWLLDPKGKTTEKDLKKLPLENTNRFFLATKKSPLPSRRLFRCQHRPICPLAG